MELKSCTYATVTTLGDFGPWISKVVLDLPCTVHANDIDARTFHIYVERHERTGEILMRKERGADHAAPSVGYVDVLAAYPCDECGRKLAFGTHVALEIAEQLEWKMPDYLAISVGDGCTIAGVWKGFKDLYAVGLIDKLPRLISAQAEGCHPINRAIAEDKPWEPMEENTLADSIAVGVPRNADKALMAIRESNGIVVNVTDEEIMAAQKLLGTTCGVFGEPAGVTGTAAVKKLCEQGVLGENDTVVSVVTGNGLKDVANAIKFCGEPMSLPNDLDLLVEEFDKRGIKTEA